MIKKNKRATLCITFIRPGDKLLDVLTRLLGRVEELGIRIKRLLLDRQFAQVAVIRHLSEQPYVSIIAIPKRGKTMKALLHGKKSYQTPYTMRSSEHGEITFPLLVVCRYQKGRARKHGVEYLTFAVIGECKSSELQIADEYRRRFEIESSYRMMNQLRAKTTFRKQEFRLLLVAIAWGCPLPLSNAELFLSCRLPSRRHENSKSNQTNIDPAGSHRPYQKCA